LPRAATNDAAPRRKRRPSAAKAVAIEREPSLMARVLLHSPKDTMASAVAFAATVAIIVNALFLQTGHHPAPMFGAPVVDRPATVTVMPRSRGEADGQAAIDPIDPKPMVAIPTPVARPVPATPVQEAVPAAQAVRPPAPIPVHRNDPLADLINSNRRVAEVQRVLTEYGYGQLKATGVTDANTQAAIRKFEADRRHPQTGLISDWLYAEVAKLTGKPVN